MPSVARRLCRQPDVGRELNLDQRASREFEAWYGKVWSLIGFQRNCGEAQFSRCTHALPQGRRKTWPWYSLSGSLWWLMLAQNKAHTLLPSQSGRSSVSYRSLLSTHGPATSFFSLPSECTSHFQSLATLSILLLLPRMFPYLPWPLYKTLPTVLGPVQTLLDRINISPQNTRFDFSVWLNIYLCFFSLYSSPILTLFLSTHTHTHTHTLPSLSLTCSLLLCNSKIFQILKAESFSS